MQIKKPQNLLFHDTASGRLVTRKVTTRPVEKEPAFTYNHVLLVDDSDMDRMVGERLVQYSRLARHVTAVSSADGALEFLGKCTDLSHVPQLLLLDLDMPGKSGFDFLQAYEHLDPMIKLTCSIIIVSSSDHSSDRDKAFRYHTVSGYLVKPLDLLQMQRLRD